MPVKLKLALLLICLFGKEELSSQNVGFEWAKQMSGLIGGQISSLTLKRDTFGNIYCGGRFLNTVDFDPSPAVYTLNTLGYAPFVAKYDSGGNLIWAKHFRNPFTVNIQAGFGGLCIDNTGNVYCTGSFQDFLDFDPGPGTFTMNFAQSQMYLCKLNASGNFVWALQMGGVNTSGHYIEVDSGGNPIIVGGFKDTINDFDPGPGIFNLSSLGKSDIFVCKMSPSGNLIWAKQFGGTEAEYVRNIDLDNLGNIVSTGIFSLTVDFDPGPASFTMNSQNGQVFVNVLDGNGNFISSWQIANGSGNSGNYVTTDNSGNIFVCGAFVGTGDFDPGPGVFSLSSVGIYDCYVSKFTSTGAFVWAKQLGGVFAESPYCVQVDPFGGVYIAGYFAGVIDLDPGPGTYTFAPLPAFGSGFISKLDANGNFIWAKQFIGPGGVDVRSIILDGQGNIFATGVASNGTDLDPGPGTFTISVPWSDAYLLKLSSCFAAPSPSISASALSSCGPSAFTMSASPTTSITWRTQLMSNTYISTLSVLNTTTLPVGTYSFYAASSNTCAESFPPALAQVSVFPIPTISIVSSKDTFCLGESVVLTANGGLNYVMGSTFSSGTFVVWPTPATTYTITGGDVNNCYSTASITLEFDLCTRLTENDSDRNGLQIWPNPGKGEFHVKGDNITVVEIYNTASQLIYSEAGKNSSETDVSTGLPPGIYYIKVIRADASWALRKLVVLD